jgi:PPOX class probable F420-dependent enzyme
MTVRVPQALARRMVAAGKKPMNGMRHADALTILDRPVRAGDFGILAGHDHCLLVTYKRDGTGVPSPVWFAVKGDRLYVWTEINAYKAKRLRRDPRALIAPCGPTGKPLGDPIAVVGRVLETPEEREEAARLIRSQWHLGRLVFERLSRPLTDVHYLEFTLDPDRAS